MLVASAQKLTTAVFASKRNAYLFEMHLSLKNTQKLRFEAASIKFKHTHPTTKNLIHFMRQILTDAHESRLLRNGEKVPQASSPFNPVARRVGG